jgi:hypothetical protein
MFYVAPMRFNLWISGKHVDIFVEKGVDFNRCIML